MQPGIIMLRYDLIDILIIQTCETKIIDILNKI